MPKTNIFKHTAYPAESSCALRSQGPAIFDRSAFIFLISFSVLILLLSVAPVFGHGGKNHGEDEFTRVQSLKEATALYDRLLASGKLDASWETGLERILVSISAANEYVVSFQRNSGDPSTVYFFFNDSGKYVGSNFTGP